MLPSYKFHNTGDLGRAFNRLGITDFPAVCRYVQELPYGRTTDRADWLGVLRENRGSCSTKHALVKALAAEIGISVALYLGIFQMCEKNTPGVGKILSNAGLEYIPEAHCYLKYRGHRIDLTGLSAAPVELEFLQETEIEVCQIGAFKVNYHQMFIKQWYGEAEFDRIWLLREACIAALGTG
ncbi:hypothetical protein [Microbulbifer sp. TYP-18]|uniref:hypothetical protein n=1 Tax=Microbulbifer sp. TYP-18 TaxID=3230024 RepID=UPI0034C69A2D